MKKKQKQNNSYNTDPSKKGEGYVISLKNETIKYINLNNLMLSKQRNRKLHKRSPEKKTGKNT